MIDTYSVAELTAYIRGLFEKDLRMQDVRVQGEISNLTRAASGHLYFTLKDARAQIKCVMWRSNVERLTRVPANGDSVSVHGAVSVYEQNGVYQLYADSIRAVGLGDLYVRFEQLKAKLEAEGLFDRERKRSIPALPRQIGVVTSADAAAFQDIQHVLGRRFPLAEVILSPTLVQGADAPAQIIRAIERLNLWSEADVILVCRGGGSIEDLWAFNDEGVARAIAASRIPIISGVGHETDFTIADFAADLRAPTPSAAAEIATPDLADLRAQVSVMKETLPLRMLANVEGHRRDLKDRARTLRQLSPVSQIRAARQRIDDWVERLDTRQQSRLDVLRERLQGRSDRLERVNPSALLQRGYAIVRLDATGARVRSTADLTPDSQITIQLQDGQRRARVEAEEL